MLLARPKLRMKTVGLLFFLAALCYSTGSGMRPDRMLPGIRSTARLLEEPKWKLKQDPCFCSEDDQCKYSWRGKCDAGSDECIENTCPPEPTPCKCR